MMNTVRIRKIKSKRTPWEVFQGVYAFYPSAFFLDSLSYQPPAQRYSYIGWNPFAEVRITGQKLQVIENKRETVKAADQLWPVLRRLMRKYQPRRRPGVPFFTGGAVGFWGYELAGLFEPLKFRAKPRWGQVPDLHLGFYRSVVIYDHKEKCYYLAAQNPAGGAFREMEQFICEPLKNVPQKQTFRFSHFKAALKQRDFEKAVRKAKRYIAAGDIYQANLSQRFHFDYAGSSLALYGALRQINPSPFSVFLKSGELDIVSSSPERLVSKRGEWCETKPIAGTRPRGKGRGERALTRELLTNEKERAEHLMLVDLERNDLGRVCRWPTVKVNEFMKVEKYSHVMHLVSRITGRLRADRDGWDLIQAMFPGGTITGCPKIRCMEIIDELEPETRGIYTGSIGYVDFNGDADLNIVIRTLVLKNRRGFYQTGAGIVHDSIPRREYEETLHKGEALKQALKKAGRSQ